MVAHRIQDGNGQVPEALSADAVQRLLIGYGVALDTAAALPAFVQPGVPYCLNRARHRWVAPHRLTSRILCRQTRN